MIIHKDPWHGLVKNLRSSKILWKKS